MEAGSRWGWETKIELPGFSLVGSGVWWLQAVGSGLGVRVPSQASAAEPFQVAAVSGSELRRTASLIPSCCFIHLEVAQERKVTLLQGEDGWLPDQLENPSLQHGI